MSHRKTKLFALSALGVGLLAQGCLDRPLETLEPRTTQTVNISLGQNKVDKIDILLSIDDSDSMADKQIILSEAVPRLVESLVNPACVPQDEESAEPWVFPATSTEECPDGYKRRFDPVHDIHVGVITSSIDVPSYNGCIDRDDKAQLIENNDVSSYQDLGFLAWDPNGKKDPAGQADDAVFVSDMTALIQGVGQGGCGFEQSLESWYRFLVDPDVKDPTILQQRKAFLRPDSLVAVVMLSDENDCSFDSQGGFDHRALYNQDPRQALYCWLHDEYLYPVERYIAGLTQTTIENQYGNLVDNPLFVRDGKTRSSDNVFLTGIVGVPWQHLAEDPNDLSKGIKTAERMRQTRVWDAILGDPQTSTPPSDPRMVEDNLPRPGLPLAGGEVDSIMGNEHSQGNVKHGELQYACIFDLPESEHRDCANAEENCDCDEAQDRAVCREDDGSYSTWQRKAKAYPGTRQLQVLKGLNDQGIVASICASQLDDDSRADYGYQPAIGALVDRLATKLGTTCLPRELKRDGDGQVACLVIEGKRSEGGACSCDGAARSNVPSEHNAAVAAAQQSVGGADLDCFCQVDQLGGDELAVCLDDPSDDPKLSQQPVDGWCYVDHARGGDTLPDQCSQTIRLVGAGEPENKARLFITCANER